MNEHELEAAVHQALDNAIANGYEDLVNWDDMEIADDLLAYDADLEGMSADQLLPHIITWRLANGVPNCACLRTED